MTTQGDRVLDQPLADIGGKGLFIKELEVAMADGRADLAVHSLKDVPMDMPDGLRARGDHPRARIRATRSCRTAISTSRRCPAARASARRACGARRSCASAIRCSSILPLRGNVNTRLRKLDEGRYDAIILAAAGLKRLGFGDADRVAARSGGEPAGGRARARWRSNAAPIAPTSSPRSRRSPTATTTLATTAERAFSRALVGQLPHAARRARDVARTASCGCAACSRAATAPR